jgi:hypothetical protein
MSTNFAFDAQSTTQIREPEMGEKKRLGCLHAHHSNIAYIDSIIPADTIETVHFVEPGLLRRLASDAGVAPDQAAQQVDRQLSWMASCDLDAILVTCTNYIATMDTSRDVNIPVIKIDEPFFADLLQQEPPHLLLFSNPATVEGTMRRLQQFASAHDRDLTVDVEVIPKTFILFMSGRTDEYTMAVASRLHECVRSDHYRSVSVGQLSMVEAARRVTAETGLRVGDPLQPLRPHIDRVLDIAVHV